MRRKNSTRLKGYDYSEPGSYFVTICTKNRSCVLGNIVDGNMRLSETGKIVERCWRETPGHFENTNVDVFQVMPNHVHGIVEIKESPKKDPRIGTRHAVYPTNERSGRGLQLKTPTQRHLSGASPGKGTLGVIVRTFKGAVTTELRNRGQYRVETIWQRNYYDHIIRDDTDHFFVQQYIELNPLLWYLDTDNPDTHHIRIDDLRKMLRDNHNLNEIVLERIIEHELGYRNWWNETGATNES